MKLWTRTRFLALPPSSRTDPPATGEDFCAAQGGQSLHPRETELHIGSACSNVGYILHFRKSSLPVVREGTKIEITNGDYPLLRLSGICQHSTIAQKIAIQYSKNSAEHSRIQLGNCLS